MTKTFRLFKLKHLKYKKVEIRKPPLFPLLLHSRDSPQIATLVGGAATDQDDTVGAGAVEGTEEAGEADAEAGGGHEPAAGNTQGVRDGNEVIFYLMN